MKSILALIFAPLIAISGNEHLSPHERVTPESQSPSALDATVSFDAPAAGDARLRAAVAILGLYQEWLAE